MNISQAAATAGIVGDYSAIACDDLVVCALDARNHVDCWGSYAASVTPPPEVEVTQMAMVSGALCGILADQTVECWGQGQVMTGLEAADGTVSGAIPSGTFTQIDGGSGGACGVRTDGTLSCWGSGAIRYAPNGSTYHTDDPPVN